jgi:SAM-dependent methyltransferase
MNADQQLTFDLVASAYDEEFTHTAIGRLQRARVHHYLKKSLPGHSLHILEINCGSGEDAVWLAKKGHQVTATDASPKMIAQVREKVAASRLDSRIVSRICDFDDLSSVFAGEQFDLIFSDFGGLNCVSADELEKLSEDFSHLLRPNGKFIAVVMGRGCLWERFYFLLKGNRSEAFRRNSKEELLATVGNSTVPTWYYSPDEFMNLFSARFLFVRKKPVGLAIPPSYLNPFFEKRQWLLSILQLKEKLLSFSVFSNLSDHFYIEMKKR